MHLRITGCLASKNTINNGTKRLHTSYSTDAGRRGTTATAPSTRLAWRPALGTPVLAQAVEQRRLLLNESTDRHEAENHLQRLEMGLQGVGGPQCDQEALFTGEVGHPLAAHGEHSP